MLDYVCPNRDNIQGVVKNEIAEGVKRGIKKGKQASRAPEFNQPIPTCKPPNWRDTERHKQNDQSRKTRPVLNKFNRVIQYGGSQKQLIQEQRERSERTHPGKDFQQANVSGSQ